MTKPDACGATLDALITVAEDFEEVAARMERENVSSAQGIHRDWLRESARIIRGSVSALSETPRIETSPEDMTASLRYLHLSTAPDGQWADQAVHSFVGAMLKSSPKAWSEMNGFERAAYNAGAEAASVPSATPQKPLPREYEDMRRRNRTLELALIEIMKGEGPFSRDPLTHATSTIESMKKIATDSLYATGNL